MPSDANGIYSLPSGYQAIPGQTILASQHNPPLEDIAAGLTARLMRDGRAPMLGNLDLGGFRAINGADGTNPGDYITLAQAQALIAGVDGYRTGDWKFTLDAAPPPGWLRARGRTIGSAASGATERANADTQALYVHLWNACPNTILPIQTSAGVATTRGSSAAADFAANKRLPLPDPRTRAIRIGDMGLGFDTSLIPGLVQDDAIKNHVHPFTTDAAGNHGHPTRISAANESATGRDSSGGFMLRNSGPTNYTAHTGTPANTAGDQIGGSGTHTHPGTTNNNTGGSALETRGRSIVLNAFIKL